MHPAWEQLADYVDKRLSETEADQITLHLATCEQCAHEVEWLDDSTRLLRADVFVAPPRNVRMAAELAFEQRFTATTPAVAPPFVPVATPPPAKIISPPTSYWRRSLGIVAAIAAVLILWVISMRSLNRPIIAAVASQQGDVQVRQGQEGTSLLGGDGLSEGSQVRTGTDGTAQLAFGAGAVEVVMLEGSNLIYQTSVIEDGSYQQVNLFTDTAGDLELNAKEGVRIHLRTGIGLLECTGCQFRFHYLEPKIVAVNTVRGVVTVTNDAGDVYDLNPGEQILDYSQPEPTHTPLIESTAAPEPTVTSIPATATTLPTRAAPTATLAPPTDEHGGGEHEDNSGSGGGDHDASVSDSGTQSVAVTVVVVATATTVPPTAVPEPTSIPAPPPPPTAAPEENGGNNSGGEEQDDNSGSGGGNDHDDNSGSGGGNDHDDNSGPGGGGNDHDDNSGSGGGGNDHDGN